MAARKYTFRLHYRRGDQGIHVSVIAESEEAARTKLHRMYPLLTLERGSTLLPDGPDLPGIRETEVLKK